MRRQIFEEKKSPHTRGRAGAGAGAELRLSKAWQCHPCPREASARVDPSACERGLQACCRCRRQPERPAASSLQPAACRPPPPPSWWAWGRASHGRPATLRYAPLRSAALPPSRPLASPLGRVQRQCQRVQCCLRALRSAVRATAQSGLARGQGWNLRQNQRLHSPADYRQYPTRRPITRALAGCEGLPSLGRCRPAGASILTCRHPSWLGVSAWFSCSGLVSSTFPFPIIITPSLRHSVPLHDSMLPRSPSEQPG